MNRRGMALLATLWLLAALSAVAGTALAMARIDRGASLNSIALTRGSWAAEGCLAVLQAQMGRDSIPREVDSTDLGGGIWCRSRVEDANARISLDQASPEMLDRLLGDHHLTAALLDWMDPDDEPRVEGAEASWYRAAGRRPASNAPLASVDELHDVAGFDSAIVERLRPFVTVHGTGRIAVNSAPPQVLAAIPGFEPATVEILLQLRRSGRSPRDLDGLLSAIPANLRVPLAARYGELQGRLSFTTERVIVHLEGHVPEAAIVATPTVIAIPAGARLAIVAWEAW